ncbi:THAP domain-containing protein 2-like [Myzus persicae]|uniref:THAP domain-containing protein 2-like n=1 Tax=Myzus persicae TaxID=13164 RepID=UPI000B9346D2|nr:THAP domain-containing protein 2-like [Myzus persicae]
MNCSNAIHATTLTNSKKPNFNSCVMCLKSKKKGYNISLHKFPKDPIRRAVWLKNCSFVEKEIEHNRMLCSSHFEKDCLVQHSNRRVLKRSAVPVIFDEKKRRKRNKKRSQQSQSLQKSVASSNSKVYFIPAKTYILVKPIVQNSVNTTYTQNTQTSGLSETILQIKVEDLENPAADVIPLWVLRQFTDQLSGYSLDPEKNDVPIFASEQLVY